MNSLFEFKCGSQYIPYLCFLSLAPASYFCILKLYLQPGYNPPPHKMWILVIFPRS